MKDLAARDRGRGRGRERCEDDCPADDRGEQNAPRPGPAGKSGQEGEDDGEQENAAPQIVRADQERRRPADAHHDRQCGEHRPPRRHGEAEERTGCEERNEDHALHPGMRVRRERELDVVELEEPAPEACE